MKTLIVYSSKTGFTKRYTEWLAKRISADTMTIADAYKKDDSYFKDYDAIIYGGWLITGKIHKSDWFIKRINKWKDKRLAMFCVGASPISYHGINDVLGKVLTDEQKKYAKVFYCEGGIDYDKLSLGSKVLMKAFAAMLKNKKDKTADEEAMAEHVSKSCDCSDPKFIEPIAAYISQ